MRDHDNIVRERQKLIRREMDRRGIAIKAVQLDGGWDNSSTVLSYFPADANAQPAVMSLASLDRLFGALPLDLLSLLLPAGHQIVQVPEAVDHDEAAEAMREYLAEKDRAHHPESPKGRDIADCEDEALRARFAVVTGGKAAA